MITSARVILFLTGLLIGLFFTALLAGGALGINAVTLIAVALAIIFVLKLPDWPTSAPTIAGLVVGILIALLVAALSPVALGVDALVVLLVLLIVK